VTARPFELHSGETGTRQYTYWWIAGRTPTPARMAFELNARQHSDCSNHSSYSSRTPDTTRIAFELMHYYMIEQHLAARIIRATTGLPPLLARTQDRRLRTTNHTAAYLLVLPTTLQTGYNLSPDRQTNNHQLHTVLVSSTGAVVAPQLCARSGTP